MAAVAVRPAVAADSEVLLSWRNDPAAYRWYRSPALVTREEHQQWLAERLAVSSPDLWIAVEDSRPVGSVRLDQIADDAAAVSVVVDPDQRGRGVGGLLLAFADEEARRRGLSELRADVHRDNAASQALFSAAGYVLSASGGAFDLFVRPVRPDPLPS